MDRGKPLSDTRPQGGHLRGRQRTAGPEKITQVPAVDVVHDDGEGGSLDDDVANGDDIRTTHSQQRRTLLDEAIDDVGILHQIGAQHLEGQDLAGVSAPTSPDLALGACPDPGLHDVGASEVTGGGALGRHEGSVSLKGWQVPKRPYRDIRASRAALPRARRESHRVRDQPADLKTDNAD